MLRPIPEALPKAYSSLGLDYVERVLPSATSEDLKSVVAQLDAGELITQRDMLSQKVSIELTERPSQLGLALDDASIVSSFP